MLNARCNTALYSLGSILGHGPKSAAAQGAYQAAIAIAPELGMRLLVARCHFGVDELHQRMRRLFEARAEYSQATGLYRQMGMQIYLKQAEAEL